MKNEIEYKGYLITASVGYYWIEGIRGFFKTLKEAKEYINELNYN